MRYEAIILTYLMIGAVLGLAQIEIWNLRGRLLPTEDLWNTKRIFFYLFFPAQAVSPEGGERRPLVARVMGRLPFEALYIVGYALVWPVPAAYRTVAVAAFPGRAVLAHLSMLVCAFRARHRRLVARRRSERLRRAVLRAADARQLPGGNIEKLARLLRRREAINRQIERMEMAVVFETGILARHGKSADTAVD